LYYLSTGTQEPAGINSFCAAWSNAALNECSNYNRTVCLPDCYATPDNCLDQLNACINQAGGGGGGSSTPPSLTATEVTKANLGPTCDEDACVPKPINLATGNMYFQHADYRAGGLSENLSVIRSYNSQSNFSGLFGMGWSTDYDISLTVESDLRVSVMFNDGGSVYYYRPSTGTSTFAAYAPPTDKSNVILNAGANTYTLVLKSNGKYVFNTNGKLVSIIDPNGNTTSLAYDGSNRLVTVASPTGRTLNFAYNASGKVAAISDGASGTIDPSYNPAILGTIATYDYDPASEYLSRATYSDGSQYRYTYTYNAGTSKYYITAIKDALDNPLESHEYDAYGRAQWGSVTGQVEGNTITYVSDTETRVTDALGRISTVIFDKSKGTAVVTSKTEPYYQQTPVSKLKEYDSSLNMISETDEMGYKTLYAYDFDGNVTNISTPKKNQSLTYNDVGQILTHSDSLGGVTNTYDSNGNLLTSTDSLGAVTSFTYNSNGLPASRTDPLNHLTHYAYDQFGNLTGVTNALNQTSASFAYDIRGRMTRATDALGNNTYYAYDARDRLVLTTYPDNSTEQRIHNLAGKLVEVIDPRGNSTAYAYDGYGRLVQTVEPQGRIISISYDLMSNITAKTDSAGRTTNYSYNSMNLLDKITYPEATPGAGRLENNFLYDAVGNLTEKRDTANHITQFSYDGDRRAILSVDAAQNASLSDHDSHDNLSMFADANENTYDFVYDYHDRLKSISRDNGAKSRQYAHDLAGRLTAITDYDGSVTNYSYDALNRLTGINYPDSTSASFSYNQASQMLTATNENGTVVFTYDNRGRVSSVTDVWGKLISYNYDANGNRTQMSIGNRTITYQYDSLNRLTGLYENTGNTAVFAYDNAGRLQTRTLNSLLVTTYAYNGLDLPTTINYMVGASTLANFAYEYGTDLNVSKITDRNGSHFYYYNDNSQLVSATHSTFATESFSYDEIGNHINQDGTTPPPQNVSYEYDLNGDLKARIDPAGNPEPNKNIVYKYDALGRLVARVNGTQWTRYTYDGDDAVLDEKSDGTVIYYGNGPGIDNKLWYIQGTSSPVFFLADHLGSTRALVSHTGSIIAGTLIDYDSFGKPSISLPTRFQYAGREYDPDTQLYYHRARYYDPQARRFISEDPIGLEGGINLYGYVGNNPLNLIDPYGLQEKGYWRRSGEQIILGNFTDEVTLAGTAGQIGTGLLGVDLPGDIRDISADLINWKWSWGHAGQTALDAIGFLPVIGVLKYGDEVGTLCKSTKLLNQFNSADSLIKNAGDLTRLKGGVKMGTVTGNGEAIFRAISNGGQMLPSGYVKMADGTIIGKHVASSTGEFTIDINQAGQIYKIRVNP